MKEIINKDTRKRVHFAEDIELNQWQASKKQRTEEQNWGPPILQFEQMIKVGHYKEVLAICKKIVKDAIESEQGEESDLTKKELEKREISKILSYDYKLLRYMSARTSLNGMRFIIENLTPHDLKENLKYRNFTVFELFIDASRRNDESNELNRQEFKEAIEILFEKSYKVKGACKHYLAYINEPNRATFQMREDINEVRGKLAKRDIVITDWEALFKSQKNDLEKSNYCALNIQLKSIQDNSRKINELIDDYGQEDEEVENAKIELAARFFSAQKGRLFRHFCSQADIKSLNYIVNHLDEEHLRSNISWADYEAFKLFVSSCNKDGYKREEFRSGLKIFLKLDNASPEVVNIYKEKIKENGENTHQMLYDLENMVKEVSKGKGSVLKAAS